MESGEVDGLSSTDGRTRGTVRLIRCLARSAPNKTDADGAYVIAVVGIVIGSFQGVEKPFIAVTQAQIGLIRQKNFDSAHGTEESADIPVVPGQTGTNA